jgi:hypothetical protein
MAEANIPPQATPPGAKPAPEEHACDHVLEDGTVCGASAPFGFGLKGEPMLWACGAHQQAVGDRYADEKTERLKKARLAMQPAQGKLI